jgi:hypothetical protein
MVLHNFVEDISLLIDSAPEIAFLAIDGDDDLVEMQDIMAWAPYAFPNGVGRLVRWGRMGESATTLRPVAYRSAMDLFRLVSGSWLRCLASTQS